MVKFYCYFIIIIEFNQLNLSNNGNSDNEKLLQPGTSSIKNEKKENRDVLTEDEIRVLFITSRINKNTFIPFLDKDKNERFNYTISFW